MRGAEIQPTTLAETRVPLVSSSKAVKSCPEMMRPSDKLDSILKAFYIQAKAPWTSY